MKRKSGIGLLLAFALLSAEVPRALAQEAAKPATAAKPAEAPEPVKTGDLKVIFAIPAKATLKQATVFAKERSVPAPAAGQEVLVAGVQVGKAAVTVDAVVEEGGKKKRLMGVTETTVVEGPPQNVAVKLAEVTAIDAFCLPCHPNPRDPKVKVKPGQIVRDIHSSGREYPEKGRDRYLAQNKAHNERIARLEKEGKPHSYAMPLDERVVKLKGGKEVTKYFYTCETCHTLHLSTPWVRYVRAAYRDKSDLCVGCHF